MLEAGSKRHCLSGRAALNHGYAVAMNQFHQAGGLFIIAGEKQRQMIERKPPSGGTAPVKRVSAAATPPWVVLQEASGPEAGRRESRYVGFRNLQGPQSDIVGGAKFARGALGARRAQTAASRQMKSFTRVALLAQGPDLNDTDRRDGRKKIGDRLQQTLGETRELGIERLIWIRADRKLEAF